jgi:hypothetical protein
MFKTCFSKLSFPISPNPEVKVSLKLTLTNFFIQEL